MSRTRGVLQPQYDFIGGDGAVSPNRRQPLRESLRASSQPMRPPADDSNESLRKELHKLKYEIDSLKQERDLTTLRHDEELRAAQAKAEADYKRAQLAESAQNVASSKHEQLARELHEAQEQAAQDRDALERRMRSLQESNSMLQEQAEEKETEIADQERHYKHDMDELQARYDASQRDLENIRQEGDACKQSLDAMQQTVTMRDEEIARLQSEAVGLKTQTGDADTLAIIKRELSEQVAHIKDLESQNSKQAIQLKKLQEQHKSVELVQEEKRNLENRLTVIDQLNRELSEARLQRQILEDERRTWTSYLENESASDDDFHFDSPEQLAKAFVEARLEKLALVDQLGKVQPDLHAKDDSIQSLETQVNQLRSELDKAKSSGSAAAPASKAQARTERQRVLAVKEVEYLRAQLKMFDAEEAEMSPEKHDERHAQRLAELQGLIDEHRRECDSLRNELERADSARPSADQPSTGSKRQRTDDGGADDGHSLSRKARALQNELSRAATAKAVLQKDLAAARAQLSALQSPARTRVLELRANPTAAAAAVKTATLAALRAENEALLARLDELSSSSAGTRSSRASKAAAAPGEKLVPAATLERLRADLARRDEELASKDKKYDRLTKSFQKRSLEIRETVASILGWKLDIMPNGRVRVRSMLDPARKGGAADADDEERSIVFDGEQGTMKVSGGPQSRFAGEIRGHIDYWVDGRGEVPCFLAATTLDFWERGQGTTQV